MNRSWTSGSTFVAPHAIRALWPSDDRRDARERDAGDVVRAGVGDGRGNGGR